MQLGYGPVQTLCTRRAQRAIRPPIPLIYVAGSMVWNTKNKEKNVRSPCMQPNGWRVTDTWRVANGDCRVNHTGWTAKLEGNASSWKVFCFTVVSGWRVANGS